MDIYALALRPGKVDSTVLIQSVSVEDIYYVILSHLHLDHAGGVGHFSKPVDGISMCMERIEQMRRISLILYLIQH